MHDDRPGTPARVPLASSVATDATMVCALGAIARGQTVAAAAANANISPRSLHRQLQAAKDAHQAHTTIHLVVKFVRAGLV